MMHQDVFPFIQYSVLVAEYRVVSALKCFIVLCCWLILEQPKAPASIAQEFHLRQQPRESPPLFVSYSPPPVKYIETCATTVVIKPAR